MQVLDVRLGLLAGLWLAANEGMEKKMETTILGYIGTIIVYVLGLYWDNGKENGNYYNGLYMDYYRDPFLHS